MPDPVYEITIGEVAGNVYFAPQEKITWLPVEIANETGATI